MKKAIFILISFSIGIRLSGQEQNSQKKTYYVKEFRLGFTTGTNYHHFSNIQSVFFHTAGVNVFYRNIQWQGYSVFLTNYSDPFRPKKGVGTSLKYQFPNTRIGAIVDFSTCLNNYLVNENYPYLSPEIHTTTAEYYLKNNIYSAFAGVYFAFPLYRGLELHVNLGFSKFYQLKSIKDPFGNNTWSEYEFEKHAGITTGLHLVWYLWQKGELY